MTAEPKGDAIAFRVTFKDVVLNESVHRTALAKSADDAVGYVTDALRSLHELDIDKFHEQYRLVAVVAESHKGA